MDLTLIPILLEDDESWIADITMTFILIFFFRWQGRWGRKSPFKMLYISQKTSHMVGTKYADYIYKEKEEWSNEG